MTWSQLPPAVRETAERVCTEREITALRLWENGCGYRRIGLILGISMSSARGRVHRAIDKINHTLEKETRGHHSYPVRQPDRQATTSP